MLNPNPAMLLRIGQGDAYGMAVEYIKLDRPYDRELHERALKFERYLKHPTHQLRAGQYTDDTQMSIAVAEVLLQEDLRAVTDADLKRLFADSFATCFVRDPRDGYSRGFQAILNRIKTGKELIEAIKPDSDKNGAAMRSVPIGVLSDPNEVVRIATVQAKVTHDTVGGVQSSILVALMSHFALWTNKPFTALPLWLSQHTNIQARDWAGGPVQGPGVGMNTADAVYTLLRTRGTLLNIARTAIEWGGDVDSVLAIAWGIASTRMHEALPEFFGPGLEDGTYGRRFLGELGTRLMKKYASPTFDTTDPQKPLA